MLGPSDLFLLFDLFPEFFILGVVFFFFGPDGLFMFEPYRHGEDTNRELETT